MPQRAADRVRPRVEADCPAAAAALHALAEVVLGQGGALLPGTVFRVDGGQLTVHRAIAPESAAPDPAPLIAVPAACLPPVGAFRVTLDRGRLDAVRVSRGPAATALQARAFAAMLDLYNALEKPWQWSRQSPWLTLWDDPALLGHLAHADEPFGQPRALALYRAGAWRRLLVGSFLRSRAFALRPQPGGPTHEVLLPLLDALDHHDAAGRFVQGARPGRGGDRVPVVQAPQTRPVSGSDACRVAYNVLDARLALLHYGFLDTSAPYVLSVPVRVPLADGAHLCVLSATGRYQEPLAPGLELLRPWLPRVLRAPPEVLAVTRLPIPPAGEVGKLHAVLHLLIARRWPHQDEAWCAWAAARAAGVLLAANRRDHARMAELLQRAHARSGRGDLPGRRATLSALDRLLARAAAHFPPA